MRRLAQLVKKAFYKQYFLHQCQNVLSQICQYPFCREKRKLFCKKCEKEQIDSVHFFHTSDHILSYAQIAQKISNYYYIKIQSDKTLLNQAKRLFQSNQKFVNHKKAIYLTNYQDKIYCIQVDQIRQDRNAYPSQVFIQSIYSQNLQIGNLIPQFIQFVYQQNQFRQSKLHPYEMHDIFNTYHINQNIPFCNFCNKLYQRYWINNEDDDRFYFFWDTRRQYKDIQPAFKKKDFRKARPVIPKNKISKLQIHRYL